MADERYYRETIYEISLESILPESSSSEVGLELVETSNITVSSYRTGRDNQFAFVFKTEHGSMNSQIILYPQDIMELASISEYKSRFFDDNERGLFIPKDIPSLEQCAFCGHYLREYGESDEPNCKEDFGHIWCFEYDRVLVFHGSCLQDLVSVLESQIEDKPEKFISGTL